MLLGVGGREETVMANEPLQVGDLVEILSTAEHVEGRPGAARRYGYVIEEMDEDRRFSVQVPERRYPLHVPLVQLHRMGDHEAHCTGHADAAADGVAQTPLTVMGVRYGLGSNRGLNH
jgi:hypothetical protein